MYVCVSTYRCIHVSAGAHRGQRMASDPPELASQEAVSHQKRMLGTELRYPQQQQMLLTANATAGSKNNRSELLCFGLDTHTQSDL